MQKIEKGSNHHLRHAFFHRMEVITENVQVNIDLYIASGPFTNNFIRHICKNKFSYILMLL